MEFNRKRTITQTYHMDILHFLQGIGHSARQRNGVFSQQVHYKPYYFKNKLQRESNIFGN